MAERRQTYTEFSKENTKEDFSAYTMPGVFGDSTFNLTNASSIKLYDELLLSQIVIVVPKVVCRSERTTGIRPSISRGTRHRAKHRTQFNGDKKQSR
jgi:hypothetical protein